MVENLEAGLVALCLCWHRAGLVRSPPVSCFKQKEAAITTIKIGFTGTQEGMTVKQLRGVGQVLLCHLLVEYLPVNFHHGDCIGADAQAHTLARALWFRVFIHPPTDESKRAFCKANPERIAPSKPYLDRNKDIVAETDVLIATPSQQVGEVIRGSGTWYTVRYARKLGRQIYIVRPDGRIILE